jgi:molybdopterin/thiamine biosynthesis adenylyltransferase
LHAGKITIMNDNQLLRYSRHILLPQIAYEGQEALTKSRALILGAGGLGSPVALYMLLAALARSPYVILMMWI